MTARCALAAVAARAFQRINSVPACSRASSDSGTGGRGSSRSVDASTPAASPAALARKPEQPHVPPAPRGFRRFRHDAQASPPWESSSSHHSPQGCERRCSAEEEGGAGRALGRRGSAALRRGRGRPGPGQVPRRGSLLQCDCSNCASMFFQSSGFPPRRVVRGAIGREQVQKVQLKSQAVLIFLLIFRHIFLHRQICPDL